MTDMKIIPARGKDLGGFQVRRILPYTSQKMVGPFIFFDHLGPAEFPSGQGIDVRPHPHICLSTVTYLFEGSLMHRDSLGVVKEIKPHALNWMTAGSGITHSERTPDDLRAAGHTIHGIQAWVALPDDALEVDPSFEHVPADDLPIIEQDGVKMRLIAGSAYGQTAPVKIHSPLCYLEAHFDAGVQLKLPNNYAEQALYVVAGDVVYNGQAIAPHTMVVVDNNAAISAKTDAHIMILGGEPVGHREIFWNFVAPTAMRIEQAKTDWQNGNFPKVPDEDEFIPLPE